MSARKSDTAAGILAAGAELSRKLEALTFSVPYVYNSFDYAWDGWASYVTRWLATPKKTVLLGMNPGPWGMAQTGVPFGEIAAVRDWLRLMPEIRKPPQEHPKRPVHGMACPRSEVSGRRLWGLLSDRYGAPENFFAGFGVLNYCPLAFMAESGRNITPDKLPKAEAAPLFELCDKHLRRVLELLTPEFCVGVGRFAEGVLKRVAGGSCGVGAILHPSPASPAANRNWSERAETALTELLGTPLGP